MSAVAGELQKLPAFVRRDFLVAWSYRVAFFTDWIGLALQALMFYFVGLMVDPSRLPEFGGNRPTYMEFVAVGIALGAFIQLAMGRVARGIREEQMIGTFESLLLTPTATATIQVGSAVYDLIYIPLRTAVFLVLVAIGFGLHFETSGLAPAAITLLAFVPFVWGLGIASAAAILTFRRGAGSVNLIVVVMTIFSGAYFPLELLPAWATTVAELNPIAIAIDGMREPLLAGAAWSDVARSVLVLFPVSAASLGAGILAFRLAMRRERRLGTLGLY